MPYDPEIGVVCEGSDECGCESCSLQRDENISAECREGRAFGVEKAREDFAAGLSANAARHGIIVCRKTRRASYFFDDEANDAYGDQYQQLMADSPEYTLGRIDYSRGLLREHCPLASMTGRASWQLGWDDAESDAADEAEFEAAGDTRPEIVLPVEVLA